jgi:hypothetical protein
MQSNPNEIEKKLGLPENSLTIHENSGSYSFEPALTAEQERIAIALLSGNADTPDYLGFDNALLNPEEGLNLFWFVRSLSDAHAAPVGTAYNDLSRAITKGMIVPNTPLEAFQSCIDNLFAALASVDARFEPEQTAQMRGLLDKYGFSSIVFPLGV